MGITTIDDAKRNLLAHREGGNLIVLRTAPAATDYLNDCMHVVDTITPKACLRTRAKNSAFLLAKRQYLTAQELPLSFQEKVIGFAPREDQVIYVMKTARTMVLLFAALTCTGCTTLQIEETPQLAGPIGVARIAAGEAIAILTFAPAETNLEAEAVECISEQVVAAHPGAGIIKADEFRRAVFPYWMHDETEPTKFLGALTGQPVLRERMASLHIRYLILLSGQTVMKTIEKWTIPPGPPPPGQFGGPLAGYRRWDRKTELIVSILEVTKSQAVTKLHSEASGTPWVVAIFPISVGAPAFTETQACRHIGQAVAKFLSGESFEQIKADEENREK